MKNTTVLVSGAGVAGITLAYWLRRNGFVPTVVERARGIRDGGYKIDIRGAALRVVERMGLMDEIRARVTEVRAGSVVDGRGRRVASMDGDTFGGREHGDAEILRGDLHRLLFEATQGVEYLWDDSIADLRQADDHVEVTFASGATRTFDLVVGADGLHSVTRSKVFGDGHVRDLGYRVSISSVPNHLDLDREELTYVSPNRTVLVYSTAQDAGAKAMFLFADNAPVPADQRQYLADRYRDESWEVPTLLENLGADFYLDELSQVHLDSWSDGRIALVGDAAYCASAASGQGTSLALVGAYVLAGELAAACGDHVAGFAGYEAALREFVDVNQKLGPANIKRMVLATKAQVRMSMVFLSLLSRLPGKDRMIAKAMAPLHRAANAITLKDYVVRCSAA
ncbi:FAD-dependent monooxygenase [Actinophytocola oryzae]|uniref:2-polyprenyl-6-methoxyphenol hydroxylase-like FAD-dependent oxidoreductase n=1 Tax=Actinophytocola oryzae TaxID=502181 RepID=A0A4R7VSJ8_9PSEU|nr:FAD-dependent monooxygenase [Actinophytocola oryzae]TDV52197.1 2-polyprenyl-6-methoxyphenol hydroxylase-like FAD-dependent oxidoreductase [Actinophytocola oryzae]